jgi:hypothetical protein
MVPRMGIPLDALMVVHWADRDLARGDSVYSLLIYFPVLLAAETLLTVARLRHPK